MLPDAPSGSLGHRLVTTRRVAVVEDDHDIAAFVGAYFKASGFAAVHLDPSSVAQGVDGLLEIGPDAILLDLGLRGLGGENLYRAIRRRHTFDDTPVVVVTGQHRRLSRLELHGGDEWFTKPFRVSDLTAAVQRRLDSGTACSPSGEDESVLVRLDEVIADSMAGAGPASLALVRLRHADDIARKVGEKGRRWVLEHVSRALVSLLPDRVTIGATGPDELAVVMPQTPTGAASHVVQQSIDAIRGRLVLPGGEAVLVDLAAGVATCPFHATDTEALFGAADAALATAAESGSPLRAAL